MSNRPCVTSPTTPNGVCSPSVTIGEIVPEHGEQLKRRAGAAHLVNSTPASALPSIPATSTVLVKGLNRIPKNDRTLTDRESASIVKRALNDFIENPPPGAVLPGTETAARQASTLARNARGDYGGYKRVQTVDELISNAAHATGATHSGLNLQNELRKGVRTFVKEKGGESPPARQGLIPPSAPRLPITPGGPMLQIYCVVLVMCWAAAVGWLLT